MAMERVKSTLTKTGAKIGSFTKEVVDIMRRDYYNTSVMDMFVVKYNPTDCSSNPDESLDEFRIVILDEKQVERRKHAREIGMINCSGKKEATHAFKALNAEGKWVSGVFEEYQQNGVWSPAVNRNYNFNGNVEFNGMVRSLIGPERLQKHYTQQELMSIQGRLNADLRRGQFDGLASKVSSLTEQLSASEAKLSVSEAKLMEKNPRGSRGSK